MGLFPIRAGRRSGTERTGGDCRAGALGAPARADDVRALYLLLLGRRPESAAIVEAQCGRPCLDLIREGLASDEFRERVAGPFLTGKAIPHRRLDAADFEWVRDWLAQSGVATIAAEADDLALFAGFLLAEPVARLGAQILPEHAVRLTQKASALAGPEAAHTRARCERIIESFTADVPDNEEDRYYFEAHKKRYIETLTAMFQHRISGECALEIGTTFMFCHLVEECLGFRQCDVTAFDPDHRAEKLRSIAVNIGAKIKNFRAFNLDIQYETYPVSDEAYDYVMLFETLEHLPIDPMFVMQEINRVLKFSGVVFITTPNITGIGRVSEILKGQHPYFFPLFNGTSDRHNLEYSPELLAGLVEAAGFEIVRLWTPQVWEDPDPEMTAFLKRNGFPTRNRGDCLFCLARKTGPVRDRYPSLLYSEYMENELPK